MSARPEPGIVHLGIGAFFRAFGLPMLEDAMAAGGGDWGVIGVSLRSATVRDSMAARDFRYHALERGPKGTTARDIAALRDVLVLSDGVAPVLEAMARAATRIVSLTVTEKGYCLLPGSGELDLDHPGIRADIATPDAPQTALGLIVAALARRRAQGLRPFTCLSCDNLPGNGARLRNAVIALAGQTDPALADWIAAEARFPQTMVDRIVPATTAADIDEVARLTGIEDTGTVQHEPFAQWVIEDDFVDGARPALEDAGATLVQDVAPFEHMKLRCLNGTHSAMAYLGQLAGIETINEAASDPTLGAFVTALWRNDILPTLTAPPGADLNAYTQALMARYRNPGIQHRTRQIAMDGSQKLPQRLLSPLRDALEAGLPARHLTLAVAAWMRYVRTTLDSGRTLDDPLAERLRQALSGVPDGADTVAALLALDSIFPAGLRHREGVPGALLAAYTALMTDGPRSAMEALS